MSARGILERKGNGWNGALALAVSLVLVIPQPARALDNSPGAGTQQVSFNGGGGSSSSASSGGSTFEEVCQPVLDKAKNQSTSSSSTTAGAAPATPTQKLNYCQAAASAKDAADTQSILWKVWAGVAAVCTVACVASLAGVFTNQYICMGVNLAGGITDGVMTKNFSAALMSIAGVGTSFAMNGAMNKGNGDQTPKQMKDGTEVEPKKDKDIGACITAAMAGIQVYMKYKSMESSEDTMNQNVADAKKCNDSEALAAENTKYDPLKTGTGDSPAEKTAAGGGGSGQNGPPTGVAVIPKDGCSGQKASGGYQGFVSCSIASDTNLPAFVRSPKFPQEFQKASGQNFGDFLAKDQKPTQALADAMGGQMNSAQVGKLAAVLAEVEKGVNGNEVDGAAYAGGGGGGGGGEGEGGGGMDPALGQLMAGLMGKLMPGGAKEENATGVSAVAFANKNRAPASIAEDPKLSIFDRVTYRYYIVGQRMTVGGTSR